MNLNIRVAKPSDLKKIEELMKRSMKILGLDQYSEEQVSSCCQFVCVPDEQLIKDETFFIVETETGKAVGCGGWSFRKKLYAGPAGISLQNEKLNPLVDSARIRAMFTDPDYRGQSIGSMILNQSEKAAKAYGFSKGALGATLSGLSFYKVKGWNKVSKEQTVLPDGVTIEVIQMEKHFSKSIPL